MNRITACVLLLIPLFCAARCQSNDVSQPSAWPSDGQHQNAWLPAGDPSLSENGESLFGFCQDPSPGGDLCHQTMRDLYCVFRLPVIYRGFRYSQFQATGLCRDEVPPFYPDIVECLEYPMFFVPCLANRQWRPEATDLFDVDTWTPVADASWLGHIQALNFFQYLGMDAGGTFVTEIDYLGGVVSTMPPSMHAVQRVYSEGPRDWYVSLCAGSSNVFFPHEIRVPCFGYYAGCSLPPGPGYYGGPYADVLVFEPRGSDVEPE